MHQGVFLEILGVSSILLNQARAWFLKIASVWMCVCVYVSAPRAIKNSSREMKSE